MVELNGALFPSNENTNTKPNPIAAIMTLILSSGLCARVRESSIGVAAPNSKSSNGCGSVPFDIWNSRKVVKIGVFLI